ncbi:Integrase core domain protein [Afipia felis]|uniref:Integrase core domain protein n=1 Tax=Afipia felis TaxID=1035 RepID=A0A090N7I6_AFIFE|nr:Integrase core domain protein [Afipia felis]
MLCIIDKFSRESLAIRVARKLKATDVIEALCELFVSRGIPAHIRSDNGPEFVAEALRDWIATVGAMRIAASAIGQPGRAGVPFKSRPGSSRHHMPKRRAQVTDLPTIKIEVC